jgi:hypothetical protein
MLLVGAAGMIVCHFIVAAISTATDSTNQPAQKALVAFVCIFIAFFAATWGPIAWVVTVRSPRLQFGETGLTTNPILRSSRPSNLSHVADMIASSP